MGRRAGSIVGVVVLLVAVGGVAGWRWWHNRPPYGPEALAATATLSLVDQVTADAAISPAQVEQAGAGDQIVLGRVTWVRPPNPRSTARSASWCWTSAPA